MINKLESLVIEKIGEIKDTNDYIFILPDKIIIKNDKPITQDSIIVYYPEFINDIANDTKVNISFNCLIENIITEQIKQCLFEYITSEDLEIRDSIVLKPFYLQKEKYMNLYNILKDYIYKSYNSYICDEDDIYISEDAIVHIFDCVSMEMIVNLQHIEFYPYSDNISNDEVRDILHDMLSSTVVFWKSRDYKIRMVSRFNQLSEDIKSNILLSFENVLSYRKKYTELIKPLDTFIEIIESDIMMNNESYIKYFAHHDIKNDLVISNI